MWAPAVGTLAALTEGICLREFVRACVQGRLLAGGVFVVFVGDLLSGRKKKAENKKFTTFFATKESETM